MNSNKVNIKYWVPIIRLTFQKVDISKHRQTYLPFKRLTKILAFKRLTFQKIDTIFFTFQKSKEVDFYFSKKDTKVFFVFFIYIIIDLFASIISHIVRDAPQEIIWQRGVTLRDNCKYSPFFF